MPYTAKKQTTLTFELELHDGVEHTEEHIGIEKELCLLLKDRVLDVISDIQAKADVKCVKITALSEDN